MSAKLEDGVATDIHAQDWRHNGAKLMSHPDNSSKVLQFGVDTGGIRLICMLYTYSYTIVVCRVSEITSQVKSSYS